MSGVETELEPAAESALADPSNEAETVVDAKAELELAPETALADASHRAAADEIADDGAAADDGTEIAPHADGHARETAVGAEAIPVASADDSVVAGDREESTANPEDQGEVMPTSSKGEDAVIPKTVAEKTAIRLEDTVDEALLFELREAFLLGAHPGSQDFIDTCQLSGVLRSLGIALSPTEHLELINAVDSSGSGKISWQVFLAFASHLAYGRVTPSTEAAHLLEVFRAADSEGIGMINVSDFLRAAKHVEQDETDRQALQQAIINAGVAGQVNYEEFVRKYVSDRKWHSSFSGAGGLLIAS
jgi:Ca2+-binding EF-hand superfamily protein